MSLKQDVEKIVENGFKAINTVDDIYRKVRQNLPNSWININNSNCEDSYEKFFNLKQQLQLIINSKTNNDYFKLCEIQTNSGRDLKTDCNNDDVIKLIFKYFSYYQALLSWETQNPSKNVKECKTCCKICGTLIHPNETRCSICSEPIEKLTMKDKRKSSGDHGTNRNQINDRDKYSKNVERNLKEIQSPKADLTSDNRESITNIEKINVEEQIDNRFDSEIHEFKSVGSNGNNETYELLSKSVDKWFCNHCSCLNIYDNSSCEACLKERKEHGSWLCEQCNLVNLAKINKCSACDTKNERMKSNEAGGGQKNKKVSKEIDKSKPNTKNQVNKKQNKNCDNIEKTNNQQDNKINKETWICWNKNCRWSNNIQSEFCDKCKLQRNPPENPTDLISKNAQNKACKVWICQKCQRQNGENDPKCKSSNCGSYRFYVTETPRRPVDDRSSHNKNIDNHTSKSDHQAKEHLEIINNRWICWFCKKENEMKLEFCRHCCLEKYGNEETGAVVKMKSPSQEKSIWICYRCSKYNDLGATKCGGKTCDKTRFNNK